jgi:uncharacterized damage-inducible protein DinB
MSNTARPDPWLRGSITGIPALLQPAAHAFVLAREDVDAAVAGLTDGELWMRPGGVASLGFHLAHLAGSTSRLLSYARGQALTDAQKAALVRERAVDEARPSLDVLLNELHAAFDAAMADLAATDETTLTEPRFVGKAQLPTSVGGAVFHAAEHAARHAGQVVTTARIVRAQNAVPA